jgi:hypothetical protein
VLLGHWSFLYNVFSKVIRGGNFLKNTAGKTKNMTMLKQRGKTETDRTAEQAYH